MHTQSELIIRCRLGFISKTNEASPHLSISILKLKNISENFIPSFVMDRLSHDYKKNTFQMLHLSGEMESLSKLFFNKNIKSIYLKGPVLAQEFMEMYHFALQVI